MDLSVVSRFKDRIQTLVQENFGRLGFRFAGWSECNGGSTGLKILVAFGSSTVAAVGYALNGVYAGLQLNPLIEGSKNRRHGELVILHEFGHGVGTAS